MVYPRGEIVHQNLSAEYTDVPQLLSTLRSNGFAGTVEIQAGDKKGAFFIVSGKIINAAVGGEKDSPAVVGEEAVEELLVLSTQTNAVLNIYKLIAKQVEFAASMLQSEIVFNGLSTDFVRLDRFIKKLTNEKHTGYIEIFTKENQRVAVLSLIEGETVDLQVHQDSGELSFFEQKLIPSFLEEISKQGVMFNVYRTPAPSPAKEGTKEAEEGAVVQADQQQAKEPEENGGRTPSQDDRQKDEAVLANDRNEFVAAIQGVFLKIEKFVNGFSEKGGFQRAFKRACVEKSDSYPFLDPFEGQFDYQGGKLRLDSQVATEDFAVGVADCLNLTLTYLQKELPKNIALPQGLKGDIESSFKRYQEIVRDSGIPSVVPPTLR
jgi:hypothetical protein